MLKVGSILVINRLIKCREGERRNSNLALLAVGKEDMPPGGVVAGEVWGENERWLDWLRLRDSLALDTLLWTAEKGIKVALIWIDVLQIQFVDFRNIGASGRNKSALHD